MIEINAEQDVEVDGRTFTVYYGASAEMSYTAGVFSGPPERCYPDESDYDLRSLSIYQVAATGEPPADLIFSDPVMMTKIREALDEEVIEDQFWEFFHQGD